MNIAMNQVKNYSALPLISPYRHIVADDVLTEASLTTLNSLADQINFEKDQDYDRYVGRIFEPKILAFFLTGDFVDWLERIFNCSLTFDLERPPEFRVSRGLNLGLPLHTDWRLRNGARRYFSVLLYLSRGWHEECGGETCLWQKKAGDFELARVIAPEFGRILAFEIGRNSWHSVNQTNIAWQRQSISLLYYQMER